MMNYFNLHRKLAVINLSVVLVLALDVFVLPVHYAKEIYDRRYSHDSRGGYRSGGDYTTDYIVTKRGYEFQVPDNWRNTNIGLNEGDTFFISRSLLLRQPIEVIFRWHDGYAGLPMNFLRNGIWGRIVFLFVVVVSLLQLFPRQLISNDGFNERLIFFGSTVLAICLFFFFYH